MNEKLNEKLNEKPNLDLLRAIAILLVVFDHLCWALHIFTIKSWQTGWMGLFGVYLFFVHTCLVLMWSLQRKPHTLDFYIRRAFRIYPLAMAAVIAVVVTHLPVAQGETSMFNPFQANFAAVFSNLFLIQNIMHGGGVAVGPMWSLPLEVDMYILLPVLYFFVRKNFSLWPLLLLWGLACGLGKFYLYQGNAFPTVIPCFLPGIMAYVQFARIKPRLPAWTFSLFLFALFAFFMQCHMVAASWPVCLALGLCLPYFRQIKLPSLKRIALEIARYSYSVYLTHVFALAIAFYVFHDLSPKLQVPLMLGLTAIFSVASYHLIEKPMINYGAKLAAKAELRYEQHHADPA
ncbi:MAG: acyltransferase [Acidobacteriota bacterium]